MRIEDLKGRFESQNFSGTISKYIRQKFHDMDLRFFLM